MLITLGTGIGSGFVAGPVDPWPQRLRGESGHMVVDANGRPTTPASGALGVLRAGTALGQIGRSQAQIGLFPSALSLAGSVAASPASRSPRR